VKSVLVRASLRHLARHPAQLALAVLGIALGVAVASGIDLASGSARRAFALASEALAGRATHVVRGGPSGIPEDVYVRLRLAPGTPRVAPVLGRTVLVPPSAPGSSGSSRGPRTLELVGVDPFAEGPFRPQFASRTSSDGLDPFATALLREPGAVLLAASTARELALEPGAAFEIELDGRRSSVRLAGVLEPRDELSARALEGLLVADLSSAQELAGALGVLDRIDVRLAEDESAREAERARLEALLPSGLALESAGARAESLASMTRAFELNLRALSLLALAVGVFLVYDTLTFSVLQRRELWGTLRAIGVSRAQVLALVAGEAAILGLLGTALGLALGVGLAHGLVGLVTRTINDLYFVLEVRELELSAASLATSAALGLGATLAGALAPALEATAAPPRVVQTRSQIESRARTLAPRLALAALALAMLSTLVLAFSGRSVPASFGALFGLLLAAALAAPAATLALSSLAARALGPVFGSLGRMAARGVAAHLSRTGVAIAALSIAIATTVGMGLMVRSFRSQLERWLDTLASDVYVSAPSPVASRNTGTLAPHTIEIALAHPAVVAHSTYRGFELQDPAGGAPIFAAAVALHERGREEFLFASGEPAAIWPAFESEGAAIVSESFAYRRRLDLGDPLRLRTDRGERELRVAGIFYDYASDQGFVLVSRATYERLWDDRGVSSIGLVLEPGREAGDVVRDLRASLLEGGAPVRIRSNRELREASLRVFDRTFEITGVLRTFAALVAATSVLSALLALALERERELAVLRAQGLAPRQVQGLVLLESSLLGLFAGLVALPIGVVTALVLTLVIQRRSFGWTLELELAPATLAGALALALGSALAAGLYPAWKMARMPLARALRAD